MGLVTLDDYRKKKPCYFFSKGKCDLGDACPFFHKKKEKRLSPPWPSVRSRARETKTRTTPTGESESFRSYILHDWTL